MSIISWGIHTPNASAVPSFTQTLSMGDVLWGSCTFFHGKFKVYKLKQTLWAHTFNPVTWEVVNLRPVWVAGRPHLQDNDDDDDDNYDNVLGC